MHPSAKRGAAEILPKNVVKKERKPFCVQKKIMLKYLPILPLCLKIDPVEIQLKILTGKEHWETLIENILDRIFK